MTAVALAALCIFVTSGSLTYRGPEHTEFLKEGD